jgi:hypothetical protein
MEKAYTNLNFIKNKESMLKCWLEKDRSIEKSAVVLTKQLQQAYSCETGVPGCLGGGGRDYTHSPYLEHLGIPLGAPPTSPWPARQILPPAMLQPA